MTLVQTAVALACVALISLGQLLFKSAGMMLAAGIDGRAVKIILVMLVALALYGIATIAWVWLLKNTPLTKAYPYMALSFVLVPAASALVFGERVSGQYIIGVVLIITGLLLATR